VDYAGELSLRSIAPARVKSGIMNNNNDGPPGRESGKRINNPLARYINLIGPSDPFARKTYGSIPGIAVGTWWETRYEMYFDNTLILIVDYLSQGRLQCRCYSCVCSSLFT
jgi:E3 ubiquitin-protein ligase UHRF1